MVHKRRWLWVTAISASLGLSAAAVAQSPSFQPLKGLFGSRSAPEPKTQDDTRTTKIQVELAWLADPITFPYYLEAQIKGGNLEVHGYVPSKLVRTQAISLAKLNCPLTVIDSMKEHPSLAVHPIQRAPEQLKSAAETALREALPGQRLSVQCQADGTVQVAGSVRSPDQKLKVSQSLRRLHGCTSVANLTQAPNSAQQTPPPVRNVAAASVPEPKAAPVADTPPQKRGFLGLFGKAPTKPAEPEYFKVTSNGSSGPTTAPPPQIDVRPTANAKAIPMPTGEPYETRGLIVVSNTDAPSTRSTSNLGPTQPAPVTPDWSASKTAPAKTDAPTPALSAAQLKKRIESAVPSVRNVTVNFTSRTDVRVECIARTGDSSTAAGQLLTLPELRPYKVDLQIQLPEQN